MPSQHAVHRYLGRGGARIGPQAFSILAEFRTLPEILAASDYVCGLSGKWPFGKNMAPREGFSFWVTKPHGGASGFYDQPIIENGEVRTEPGYLTEFWTKRGIEFIEESIAQNPEKPFFLFPAYNGPCGLGSSMLEPARNRHARYYTGKRSGIMVSNYDLLPTLLNCLSLQSEIPAKPVPPGRNFAPVLRGKTVEWDDVICYEFENVRAIRTPRWDLWNGGKSKSGLITGELFGLEDPYR